MVDFAVLKKVALSFPASTEEPHFEKISFKVSKKIFATYNSAYHRVCVKLSAVDQNVFCIYDKSSIYPVPNKWGKNGWTLVLLDKISEELLIDILTTAYCEVAPAKLGAAFKRLE